MPRAWFQVWSPGKYRLRDGRLWEDTPQDVENGYRQGKAMLAAGLWVPGCWEHQPQAVPAYLSEMKGWDADQRAAFARNCFGHVADYALKDGALYAEFDVPDPADLKQLRKTRGFSPRLDRDVVDPRGRTWPGKVVSHVAATSMPVQLGRGPAALSSCHSRETVFMSEVRAMNQMNRLKAALQALGVDCGDAADVEGLVDHLEARAAGGDFAMAGAAMLSQSDFPDAKSSPDELRRIARRQSELAKKYSVNR